MSDWRVRPFRGLADVPPMLDLLLACRRDARYDYSPTAADWRQECTGLLPTRWDDVGLWEDATGRLIAWSYVDREFGSLTFRIASDAWEWALVHRVVAWAAERLRMANQERDGPPARPRVTPRDDDLALIAWLEQVGFACDGRHTIRLLRSLNDPVAEPLVPPGYTLRTVAGEPEAEAVAALHREAFGTGRMTVERRLAFMRDPTYVADLDLVAVAPDGTLAAFCRCSLSREEHAVLGLQEGWPDPIGTRPAYRRLGLARAVVLLGLHRLRQHGVDTAIIGTGNWNTALLGLATSVGFQPAYRLLWYSADVG